MYLHSTRGFTMLRMYLTCWRNMQRDYVWCPTLHFSLSSHQTSSRVSGVSNSTLVRLGQLPAGLRLTAGHMSKYRLGWGRTYEPSAGMQGLAGVHWHTHTLRRHVTHMHIRCTSLWVLHKPKIYREGCYMVLLTQLNINLMKRYCFISIWSQSFS